MVHKKVGILVPSGSPEASLARCRAAAAIYQRLKRQGHDLVIVASGGPRVISQACSDAQSMRNWLINEGADAADIRLETRALDTYENVQLSASYFAGCALVYLVSQRLHLRRLELTARAWPAYRCKVLVLATVSYPAENVRLERALYAQHRIDPWGLGAPARLNRRLRRRLL